MMTDLWTKWESLVINGIFPLCRFLGRSNHSVVFLTAYKSEDFPAVAIKLIPADPVLEEAQLLHWRTAAALSHPHLIRIFDSGRCELEGHKFLFVVMEYAEETLAEVLPRRALTPDELRDMLLPTLDVLAFLHRKNLAHGQLRPSNFLVVDDQVKLASDTIHPAESTASIVKFSLYDPPEAKDGRISAAGDIWALGITIVEALTQSRPVWPDERSETVSLPAALPRAYVETVRRCLSRDPASRPTISDLETQIKRTSKASMVSVVQSVVRKALDKDVSPQKTPRRRLFIPAIALVLLVSVAVWAGLRLFQSHRDSQRPISNASQTSSQQAVLPAAASQNPKTPVSAPPAGSVPSPSDVSTAVLHQEIPEVPLSARTSIHGHIKVTVRVTVDRTGNVVDETVRIPGPSKYFARLATEAARKWKFAPADTQNSRVWLLQFEFTRGGTTGHAAPRS